MSDPNTREGRPSDEVPPWLADMKEAAAKAWYVIVNRPRPWSQGGAASGPTGGTCGLCRAIHADWPGFSADGLRRLHVNHGHDESDAR